MKGKMNEFNIKGLTFIILVTLPLWSSFSVGRAREGKHRRLGKAANYPGRNKAWSFRDGDSVDDVSWGTPLTNGGNSAIFNVLNYGAKGDGRTDDTKAFEATWEAACKVGGSTMIVPSGSVFLIKPISFSGVSCESNIIFQLDGKIIAPTNSQAWGSGLLQWLEFTKLNGITVGGKGIIDGQGSVWWDDLPTDIVTEESEQIVPETKDTQYSSELNSKMPSTKPTALRFYGSNKVTVTGIIIQNSPQTHLKFDDCTGVEVFDVSVSSPGNSPNTDGIHLENSQDVVIRSTKIASGDDCVSIQTGCSNVDIHDVNCGPGHGISIGGLGRDHTKACVSNITVQDIIMHNTVTGVRIKTWQGGSGKVQNIRFSNIQVSEVETPIMIDQFYCDKSKCQNETSAVAVSGISYENIRGTYTMQPAHFACSDSLPCMEVSLTAIQLRPVQENYHLSGPFCWQVYGELRTTSVPAIDCLKEGKSLNNRAQSNHDYC